MSIPEIDHLQIAAAEAQLQQELLSLFIVDTQTYLQTYLEISANLHSQSWRTDIQELYRCIHTIKGEAVTVGAEAVLAGATALENMLSDLRYLEITPQFHDGYLSQILLESAELLAASLQLQHAEDAAPIVQQLQILHQAMRQRYLPQWSEHRQQHQEFAEQGFDLVVLELEIALERSPNAGVLPATILNIGQQTLTQLHQIGAELQLDSGWYTLLTQAQILFNYPESSVWRSEWLRLFQALKVCVKQGGAPVPFQFATHILPDPVEPTLSANLETPNTTSASEQPNPTDRQDLEIQATSEAHQDNSTGNQDLEMQTAFTNLSTLARWVYPNQEASSIDSSTDDGGVGIESSSALDALLNLHQTRSESDILLLSDDATTLPSIVNTATSAVEPPSSLQSTNLETVSPPVEQTPVSLIPEKVQIPVPLEKLDQSAQYLVETLLALRTTQGIYQTLQAQITQLVTLAQEGVQFVTHLRQIQDDYTLLNQFNQTALNPAQGPNLERYRQGYNTINRLLETSLRLSEIGAETGKIAQHVAENLQDVDQNVLKLQNTIQESRLVPFRNLGFRAKAILRDLTTRYGKPAQLLIQGEKTELDVSTVREMEAVILHLIRNAYDHGLESPGDRQAQGKPEQGTMTLSLHRQGNLYQFELQDDGRGMDAQAICERAKTLGLPLHSTETDADILAVICQPGFSSQSQVSEISGRGIGMDIVAAQVTHLGGQLSLQTTPGVGTKFRIQFPVPRLLVSCLLVRAGQVTFAIPDDTIKTIALVDSLPLSPVQDVTLPYAWVVQQGEDTTPLVDLAKYWDSPEGDRPMTENAICFCVQSTHTDQAVWLFADELLEQSEQIITPLPSPLIAPEGVIGVSLQPTGHLVPVLEARSVVESLLTPSLAIDQPDSPPASSTPTATEPAIPSILVVDDAALMRRRIESSLNTYGFSTHTCIDGQDAWIWLQTNAHPSLIITDIEMPNMDGFTLIDHCRQAGITVPILVISSRLSEEWSKEAHRLGASDYLTKGFSTVDLIKKVSTLLKPELTQ